MRIEPQDRSAVQKQMRSISWRLLLVSFCISGVLAYALLIIFLPGLPVGWTVALALLVSSAATAYLWQYNKVYPETYRSHYIMFENGYLQIRGLSGNSVLEAKFRISELQRITLGRRSSVGALTPIVGALDEAALIVEEKDGNSVSFEGVGWIYRSSDLQTLISAVSAELAQSDTT
jgi:hypothetical protein